MLMSTILYMYIYYFLKMLKIPSDQKPGYLVDPRNKLNDSIEEKACWVTLALSLSHIYMRITELLKLNPLRKRRTMMATNLLNIISHINSTGAIFSNPSIKKISWATDGRSALMWENTLTLLKKHKHVLLLVGNAHAKDFVNYIESPADEVLQKINAVLYGHKNHGPKKLD